MLVVSVTGGEVVAVGAMVNIDGAGHQQTGYSIPVFQVCQTLPDFSQS